MHLQIEKIWQQVLNLPEIDPDRTLLDLGGTSLNANQIAAKIQKELGIHVPVIKIFEHPTLRQFTQFMVGGPVATPIPSPLSVAKPIQSESSDHDIAIIGMACRFPGANNTDEFWKNLVEGKDSIQFLSKDELSPEVPEELKSDPRYVRARGLIEKPFAFDAGFFDVNPLEAKITDPQQRILLETAWQAMENAGHGPGSTPGRTAVFAGIEDNTYYNSEILAHPESEKQAGHFLVMTGNEKDFVAMRIAHKLNLKGPAISVHSACSTSLVAVVMACKSLRAGDCEMALAGGASVHFPYNEGYYFQEGGVFSSDGHCRPFDDKAEGTIFTDGAGIVVLKRVKDAIRDRDTIYAVIKGGAVNSDGGDRPSFSAPSISGQASCIASAFSDAGVSPGTIQFIEAHGTATPMGDPIEVEALRQVFRQTTQERQFCGIGSVKSNIGHTTAAAGVASLIKMSLALKNKMVPATVHFKSPNPRLDIQNSPFYIVDRLTEWKKNETPRRAGLSSFGIGGTNAHVILEEAPVIPALENTAESSRPFEIFPISTKTETQRDQILTDLASIKGESRDIAFTLQNGRSKFNKRGARIRFHGFECEDVVVQKNKAISNPSLVFMFPGQGSQYIEMGKSLYERFPEYREIFTKCCTILDTELGMDFKSFLFNPAQKDVLENTKFTQPALFAIEYSLGQMLLDWGITPSRMIGHSIGEFSAACLSGVFSLKDGIKMIAARGRLMSSLPKGVMLSVRGPSDQVLASLDKDVDVASINSPVHTVLSADEETIIRTQEKLEKLQFLCKKLHTSHAFHSRMMIPAVEPFFEIAQKVQFHPPKIEIISAVTGKPLTDAEAMDPRYWADHLRATVDFNRALLTSIEKSGNLFLEVGPRTTLTSLSAQHLKDDKGVAISLLGESADAPSETGSFGAAIAKLWINGLEINWSRIWAGGRRIPLGQFPFERKDHRLLDTTSLLSQTETNIGVDEPIQKELQVFLNGYAEYGSVLLDTPFVECGFDSLILMQIGVQLGKKYGVTVSLRDLMHKYNTIKLLAGHIGKTTNRIVPIKTAKKPLARPEINKKSDTPTQEISKDAAQNLHRQLTLMKEMLDQQLQYLNQITSKQGLIRTRHTQPPEPGAFRAKTPEGLEAWYLFDSKTQRYEILKKAEIQC